MIRLRVHHRDPVCQGDGEVEELLDQHDRHPPQVAQELDRPADVLDDRRLDPLGRLIHQEELRPLHHRPADGKLLLLAAGKVAAAPAHHLAQNREQLEDFVRHPSLHPRQQLKPGLEVLAHRQQREDLASLRHRPNAEPRVRLQPGNVASLENDPPGRDSLPARDRPASGQPVVAEEHHEIRQLRVGVHPPVANLAQQQHRPERQARTRRSAPLSTSPASA